MRISAFNPEVYVLGPNKRFCIWTQGCHRRCKGCISILQQSLDGGYEIDEYELANRILNTDCEGITISGGEPFLQAKAVWKLIELIHQIRDIGVIVYTGNTYEDLLKSNDTDTQMILSTVDVIIDGEYKEELDDGLGLRGSSNQRAILISNRYKDYYDKNFNTLVRANEIVIGKGGYEIIGIPNEKSKKLSEIIEKGE